MPAKGGHRDALIVVPPLASVTRPSLAAHVLQACARAASLTVEVAYANLHFARAFGEAEHESLCFSADSALWGERLFARAAYGTPAFGRNSPPVEPNHTRMEAETATWVRSFVDELESRGLPGVVGATTCFEQTAAAVALLSEVKRRRPDTITILGGSNCEGEMADGIVSIGAPIDIVFSGESETTFPAFLERIVRGERPSAGIVRGEIALNLDSIPSATYDDFFEQRARWLPNRDGDVWIPYETSRGCWWGAKHHCTFCGLNGEGLVHRERSAERALADLAMLVDRHRLRRFMMVDNIMPQSYFRNFLPRVRERVGELELFYEQKSNLDRKRMRLLKDAGVGVIQPGIESLSTALLRLMDKGVTAPQNIAMLRHARAEGVAVNWNFLYGFPGDRAEAYEAMVRLLPDLVHLHPPTGCFPISIDRFSPYFFAPGRYGVSAIEPVAAYADVLPSGADARRVAYHFRAQFESESRCAPVVGALAAGVKRWRARWSSAGQKAAPVLTIERLSGDRYVVIDTRGLPGTREITFLDRRRAEIAMTPTRKAANAGWAIENRLGVEVDDTYVPLLVANHDVQADVVPTRRPDLSVVTG